MFRAISPYNSKMNNNLLVFEKLVLTLEFSTTYFVTSSIASPISPLVYFEKNFQHIIKAIIEAKTLFAISEVFCKKSLKARLPDLYKDKSYIECYSFCQWYKDYFVTARIQELSKILFAIIYIRD